MMKAKLCEQDPKVKIMLQSGMIASEYKGKKLEKGECVSKAPKEEIRFNLERAKETFR